MGPVEPESGGACFPALEHDGGVKSHLDAIVRQATSGGSHWTPVGRGESGARVLRDAQRHRYLKVGVGDSAAALAAERDRVMWLEESDVPGAGFLEWHDGDHGVGLVTSEVPGIPADQLDRLDLAQAWGSIAEHVHRLHALPSRDCPFDMRLIDRMTAARSTVREDRVHRSFLPEAILDTPPQELLESLEEQLAVRQDEEDSSLAVCHGDLCLPNIMIDPATSQVTGFIDVGRLGRADPHADFALLFANAHGTWADETRSTRAEEDFRSRYGATIDPERLRFYLHLDGLTW